jgi:hypothetical protein
MLEYIREQLNISFSEKDTVLTAFGKVLVILLILLVLISLFIGALPLLLIIGPISWWVNKEK